MHANKAPATRNGAQDKHIPLFVADLLILEIMLGYKNLFIHTLTKMRGTFSVIGNKTNLVKPLVCYILGERRFVDFVR